MNQGERILRAIGEQPSTGAEILDDTRDFIRRFCAFPDEWCLTAVSLWTAHTHMVRHFYTTPRLALLSPEAGSGKTRVLEILHLLTPDSKLYFSPSPSTIFRTLAKTQITLLIDECDTIFTKKGKDDTNEDLRALLNSGYKRGATIPRCVGPSYSVQEFRVFASVAMAGLGDLPHTIMSRAIIIRMRRRSPTENVEPFRGRLHEPQGHEIRDRLADWAENSGPSVGGAWPDLPRGIVDRPAEVWEPLLAIADHAGGHWPETARRACIELCRVAEDRAVSLGVRLLSDLRLIFRDADALHTETILRHLVDGNGLEDDAPWADLRGKPLGTRGLASILKRYGIKSKKVWVAGRSLQGYRRDDLWDAWERYLPVIPAEAEGVEGGEKTADLMVSGPSGLNGYAPNLPEGDSCSHESGSSGSRLNTVGSPDLPDLPDMRESTRTCRKCGGEGCDWCGDWKRADGTPL